MLPGTTSLISCLHSYQGLAQHQGLAKVSKKVKIHGEFCRCLVLPNLHVCPQSPEPQTPASDWTSALGPPSSKCNLASLLPLHDQHPSAPVWLGSGTEGRHCPPPASLSHAGSYFDNCVHLFQSSPLVSTSPDTSLVPASVISHLQSHLLAIPPWEDAQLCCSLLKSLVCGSLLLQRGNPNSLPRPSKALQELVPIQPPFSVLSTLLNAPGYPPIRTGFSTWNRCSPAAVELLFSLPIAPLPPPGPPQLLLQGRLTSLFHRVDASASLAWVPRACFLMNFYGHGSLELELVISSRVSCGRNRLEQGPCLVCSGFVPGT